MYSTEFQDRIDSVESEYNKALEAKTKFECFFKRLLEDALKEMDLDNIVVYKCRKEPAIGKLIIKRTKKDHFPFRLSFYQFVQSKSRLRKAEESIMEMNIIRSKNVEEYLQKMPAMYESYDTYFKKEGVKDE